jgi:hypothetical protein
VVSCLHCMNDPNRRVRWQATSNDENSPRSAALQPHPIVFAAVADPVAAGFVESLVRPGGNATIRRIS